VVAAGVLCLALTLAALIPAASTLISSRPLLLRARHAVDAARAGELGPGRGADLDVSVIWVLAGDLVLAGGLSVWLINGRSTRRSSTVIEYPREIQLAVAQDLVDRHGEDSIAPFIVRPDKTFHFAAGGVVAYRVLGRTAVVSGDPVGPDGAAPAVLASFMETARARRWNVVVYGASGAHLDGYAALGLRCLCVGEEAVACPERFTLEGRAVRKLRQSVHRVERRGWQLVACDGVDIDTETEAEIEALESAWRTTKRRLLGFTMGMGAFEGGVRPGDLYLLARAPEGELHAVMRFIAHHGKLSLDTMRRVGETPNGLNEALVCRALELARAREVSEVSLNYAGLAHLIRQPVGGGWRHRAGASLILTACARRFQMERLVRFNEKFAPEWRPRYLVYESRARLPVAVIRTLQAEGYIPVPGRHAPPEEPRTGVAVTA
jgi:lysyl-tRNA synthetase, class II